MASPERSTKRIVQHVMAVLASDIRERDRPCNLSNAYTIEPVCEPKVRPTSETNGLYAASIVSSIS